MAFRKWFPLLVVSQRVVGLGFFPHGWAGYAPKAGALPTAQHPDMKLWDCPGVSSQSRRATNCATPRFLFPGQREVFPKSMPCICLHLKKHAVFPKCSCLYSITDFSEKCQLHLSIQSPTKTCKNAKPPVPSPFSSKKNGEEEKQGHSFSPFTIPF